MQVVAPYSAEDARGLLKAAIRDDNPVVFLENEMLYGMEFPISADVLDKDFMLPIGKAKIEREGTDVTIVSYSRGVHKALEAAEARAPRAPTPRARARARAPASPPSLLPPPGRPPTHPPTHPHHGRYARCFFSLRPAWRCVGARPAPTQRAQELAAQGVSCEVINLRTIRPLDRGTIVKSIMKTNRVVTVEEGWPQSGIGAEIGAVVYESEAFDYLDAPLERVTGADVPMPYAENLETLALPQKSNIISAVQRVCYRK